MPTITWKTQVCKNYPDQFQLNGVIEKEKAIEEFQLFPWDKETDDYRRSTNHPTVPKIVFISDDQRQLKIEAIDEKGYEIEYLNMATGKFSEAYVTADFEKNEITVEELIEMFFENKIESQLALKDLGMSPAFAAEPEKNKISELVHFSFKSGHWNFISPRAFVWLVLALIYLRLFFVRTSNLPMLGNILLISICLVPVLIHLTYFFRNYSARAIIDKANHQLTYTRGSKTIKFNREDIFRCQVTSGQKSLYSTVHNYSYVWFVLNDSKHVVITCFMADPNEIVEALQCKFEERERAFPFLPI